MRELAVAIAASIVANAVALAWLSSGTLAIHAGYIDVSAADPDDDDEPDAEPDAEPEAEREPVVVALVDEPSSEPIRPLADSRVAVRSADSRVRTADSKVRAADSTVRAADSTVRAADSTIEQADPKSRSKLMSMRGVELSLSSQAIDAVLSRRAAEAPPNRSAEHEPPAPGAHDPGDDHVGEAAELRQQIHDLDVKKLANPYHREHVSEQQLDAEREELERKRKDLAQMTIHPAGGGRYASDQKTFKASIEPDGTTHLEDAPNLQLEGLGLKFDVTDWAMRSHGDDPYSRAKMRFLDRTRSQRYEIGMQYRSGQLARSGELMQKAIDHLWATVRNPAERKQTLFELWDDCAEAGDAALVEAGAAARAVVLGVIRARVRYTADELARLNSRRQSSARFEP